MRLENDWSQRIHKRHEKLLHLLLVRSRVLRVWHDARFMTACDWIPEAVGACRGQDSHQAAAGSGSNVREHFC